MKNEDVRKLWDNIQRMERWELEIMLYNAIKRMYKYPKTKSYAIEIFKKIVERGDKK